MSTRRRIARLEAAQSVQDRPYVAHIAEGETTEQALKRFFAPYGGDRWPVAVVPASCESAEEWLQRYGPESAIR